MHFDLPSRTPDPDSLNFEHDMEINETSTRSDAPLIESLSTSTIDTVGTFGPQSKCRRPSEPSWPSITSPPRVLNEEFDCDTESPLFSLVQVISEVSVGNAHLEACQDACVPTDTINRKFMLDLPEMLEPGLTPDPFFSNSCLESPMPRTHRRDSSPISRAFRSENTSASDGSPLYTDTDIDRNSKTPEPPWANAYLPSMTSLPSPVFATPSPSSSPGSTLTPSNSFRYLRRKLRSRSQSPAAGMGPKLDDGYPLERSRSGQLSPLKFVFSSSECLDATSIPSSPRTLDGHFDQVVPTVNSTQSVSPCLVASPSEACKPSKMLDLPSTLSWLETVKPELWIDQEGFRSVQASFRLVGYSQTDRSFTPFQFDVDVTPGTAFSPGIADFIPTRRQIFIFHRSALDTPPVLRRLTTEGDDSRDFLSRQASLTIKNGVYTVRGSEASSTPSPGDGETRNSTAASSPKPPDVKFKWKFDYLVQDRRAPKSGQIMKGEKTLTPLAFSCSPWMLSLQQGKKINLMHIVKKTVTMNLTAERVEPPLPPLPPSIAVLYNAQVKAASMVLHLPPTRPNKLHSHRRARSHSGKENLTDGTSKSPLQSTEITVTSGLRHRRASSAGASILRPVNRGSNGKDMIPALPMLPRHILPPRQIAEMMESWMELDTKERQQQPKPGFVSLDMPGYHKRSRPDVVARSETYF